MVESTNLVNDPRGLQGQKDQGIGLRSAGRVR